MERVRVTLLRCIFGFVKPSSTLWQRLWSSCIALFDSWSNRVHNFTVDLGEETGLLALSLMANRHLHPFERYLWFILVIVGIFGAIMLSESQVNRYFTSPTVISVDRDYRGWSGALPAVTLCYYDRIDIIRANDYIQDHFNISVTDADYPYMIDFLNAVLSASASNYSSLAGFADDVRFDDIDLFHLLRAIDRPFEQILTTFDVNFDIHILPVMTERGACYAINSPISEIMGDSTDESQELRTPLTCQFGKQQCYIKMDLYESTGVVDIHSPFEVSTTGANGIALQKSDEIIASYKVLETVASPKLRELSVQQRKCVFNDEVETSQLKIYSKSLCLVRCRAVMALEMCNCVPFFYQFLAGPTCSPAGFECLEDFKWPIWALHICRCPSTCTEIEYTIQTVKKSSWGLKSNVETGNKIVSSFRWDLIPPKVRMRRDVVFGFDDLLVSFGGVMALCLGFSILSMTQLGFVFAYHFIQFIVDCCIFLHEKVRQFVAQRCGSAHKPVADGRRLRLSPDNLSQMPASVIQ